MGDLSISKILLILLVALVVFGPGKLPEIGKSLGKSIGEFKSALKKTEDVVKDGLKEDKEGSTDEKDEK